MDAGSKGDCNFDGGADLDQTNVKRHDTTEKWTVGITNSLKTVLPQVISELTKSFQGAGRFVLPGSGTYSFSNPLLTKWGDLIVQLTYLP